MLSTGDPQLGNSLGNSHTDPSINSAQNFPENSSEKFNDSPRLSFKDIQRHLGCTATFAELLYGRGYITTAAVDDLFDVELTRLPDPHTIIDMSKAIDRVARACFNGERIAVYGDYDVDGTCGA